jgi:flagellar protein FlaF
MRVTSLRPRATDPLLPPAIDLDSFRHVTAALACFATDTAAPAANDPAGGAERHKRLARAIHANMELWGAVLHGALDGASGLPQPLQAHLVELAEVSIRHGSYVLRGDAAVDPLIAVNRSIIEGLQPTGGKQAAVAGR